MSCEIQSQHVTRWKRTIYFFYNEVRNGDVCMRHVTMDKIGFPTLVRIVGGITCIYQSILTIICSSCVFIDWPQFISTFIKDWNRIQEPHSRFNYIIMYWTKEARLSIDLIFFNCTGYDFWHYHSYQYIRSVRHSVWRYDYLISTFKDHSNFALEKFLENSFELIIDNYGRRNSIDNKMMKMICRVSWTHRWM